VEYNISPARGCKIAEMSTPDCWNPDFESAVPEVPVIFAKLKGVPPD
jgi:hypothetical protein